MKEETHEEKLQRYIFEACKRCISNPDSETEIDPIVVMYGRKVSASPTLFRP